METLRNTVAENLGGVLQNVAPDANRFSLEEVPDQTGKVAIVTGGSEGIGYACTHTLLSKGISKLFVLSLDQAIADDMKQTMAAEIGEEEAKEKIKWIQCDMADWTRVKQVAKEITADTDRLDVLINNAGRGIMSRQLTDYGLDRHMALNHFGHVILTSHLLSLIRKSADSGHTVRISNQSSNLHEAVPSDCKFESLDELNSDIGPQQQYGRSKLANLLYARYMARNLTKYYPNVLINATHPGVVSTKMSKQDIHDAYPIGGYGMSVAMEPLKKSAFDGALSTMYAATVTEKSGQYICPPATLEPGSDKSQDEALADQLMKLTREIIKDKTKEDIVFY